MATNTSKVFIDIITQFTGTKSIKQAETSFERLAKSIGRVVSVAAIEEFGRASIKAFLADDAAANQLIKTLDNLGVAFNPDSLAAYIQNLQNTTGVLDDQLRPAFAQLAVATKDYTLSQNLLSTALDVSQGTGKSLSAVTTALSKAYLGNFAAISRLGAGVSKAQIAAKDFNAIQATLNANFGGSALAAAGTYSGKLKILKADFRDLQEKIGMGLIGALENLGGTTDIGKLADQTKTWGDNINYVLVGISEVVKKLNSIPGIGVLKNVVSFLGLGLKEDFLAFKELGQKTLAKGKSNDAYSRQKQLLVSQNKSVAATKELVKTGNAQTKAAKDKLLAEKASLVLKTAAKVLDIDQAQILAALGKQISEEDRTRLLLQQALLNDNSDAAAKLAQQVLQAQLQAVALGALNPLSGWTGDIAAVIASLVNLQAELAKVTGIALTGSQLLSGDYASAIADMNDPSFAAADAETKAALAGLAALGKGSVGNTAISPSYIDDVLQRNSTTGAYNNNMQTINLVVDGQVLTSIVTNGQQDTSASGVSPAVSRLNPYSSGF